MNTLKQSGVLDIKLNQKIYKMKTKLLIIACVVSTALFSGVPSVSWTWGDNETEAKGNWMSMEKKVKQKKYDAATGEVVWLLNNTPQLNVALYINAIKVYEKRASKEKIASKKIILQDSTLLLYKQRIELFGDEANVLNRQGRVAWKYLSKRKNQGDDLFALYSKIYELNSMKTLPENMSNYMKSACTQYVNNKIDKREMLNIYSSCNDVYNSKEGSVTSEKKRKRVAKYRQITNSTFAKNVDINCEDIESQFAEQFQSKQDVKLAKQIISLSIANKCVETSVFLSAAEFLIEKEESNYSLQKIVANVYLKNEETQKAKTAFARGIELSNDSVKKSMLYFEIAKIEGKENQFTSARASALKALSFNPELKEVYSLIGDLYFQSGGSCNTGNKVIDRSKYIAAYHMYLKGGYINSANQAKAQFPSTEEMFLYNQKPGDQVNTGCWIAENVKLEKR
jgi:tetratricopeptide (TPR) repeat protein